MNKKCGTRTRHTLARDASGKSMAASAEPKLQATRYFSPDLLSAKGTARTSLNRDQINGTAAAIHFSRT